ncbi:MAG: bifunctional diaminohydroxyphosphoribosylaminopyrimidine deaminase/5-amino-6-(5-phosphoribosylamino)uracil reductase RibD [bacterium]|nr:bifunctional diaminohydroxyphosphoribosylaminopyrimidine deaminase/5-amino-6-(5-phosphoribosylamino)uracil reductase RibD [bacterium]
MSGTHSTKHMKIALKMSRRAMGYTEPNPMVGAVVVKDDRVLAVGFHRKCGAAHAERDALRKVRETGTTLYVTLEPCIHFGKTPPCTDLIIEKKVKRVVAAMRDPNPLVNGKGFDKLRENGIEVEVGLLAGPARRMNRHYIKYITEKMPYTALRAGTSLDGKLTDKFRKSQWVTGPELRVFSHSLRGEFSAIMAGVQTVIDDDPQLTIREDAWGNKELYRVVLDTHNIMDTGLQIFKEQERFPLMIFSAKEAANRAAKVERHFFVSTGKNGGLDLREVLEVLYRQKIASVMVEGGGALISSFLNEGLYDEIILSQASTLIGGRESVQVFADGASVTAPIRLAGRKVTQFNTGHFIRAFKNEGE